VGSGWGGGLADIMPDCVRNVLFVLFVFVLFVLFVAAVLSRTLRLPEHLN
jgi:hypothetical protein